ncbi:MAG: deoxyribodipyrimidine photo-lyase, partial [Hyphomicrobiales bacterium]
PCSQIAIIDAGMRELWQTGYMHNRVRMLVASLLTKNLLIDWRRGELWFWDCLVDGDVANNPASWQWVAGCGLDAAPYFRIFNPVTQGGRFDQAGDYVRKWVPELKALPDKWIHEPASAPVSVLTEASVTIGETYPPPIVDLKASRQLALERQGEL